MMMMSWWWPGLVGLLGRADDGIMTMFGGGRGS